nr:hypothetical protein [Sphingomonas bacterium]
MACLAYLAFAAVMFAISTYAGQALSKTVIGSAVAVALCVDLLLLLVTIRRLRNAGISAWWVLLFLFPMHFSWDLLDTTVALPIFAGVTPAPLSVVLIDFQPLIACFPIIWGLMKPTTPAGLRSA